MSISPAGHEVLHAARPQLASLASQLRAYNGHRTLWIDDASGGIVHTEPDDELEALGYRYVATVLAPGDDELAVILAGTRWDEGDSPVTPSTSATAHWGLHSGPHSMLSATAH